MSEPEAPVLDAPDLGPTTAAGPAELDHRAQLLGRRFEGEWAGDLRGLSLEECELDGVTVTDALLAGLRLKDCRVSGLDAPSLPAARTEWQRVELLRSRIGAAEWYDARWRSVRVADSRLGFVNLRGARLADVELVDCRIDELDLGGATLERVRFTRCRLGTLDLTGAELRDVDLRGAELAVLTGLAGLRGATVDRDQLMLLAPLLADHVGLQIA